MIQCQCVTISGVGVSEPQLKTCSSWVMFSAIWWVYEPVKISLQGVQQSLDQDVVGLV